MEKKQKSFNIQTIQRKKKLKRSLVLTRVLYYLAGQKVRVNVRLRIVHFRHAYHSDGPEKKRELNLSQKIRNKTRKLEISHESSLFLCSHAATSRHRFTLYCTNMCRRIYMWYRPTKASENKANIKQ